MNTRRKSRHEVESNLAVIAALVVLFTAMVDPTVSASLAVVLLFFFVFLRFVQNRWST